MRATIDMLRMELESKRIEIDQSRLFAMLEAESCTQCCTQSAGGNGSCPPPKKLE
jgi:hypothetical protein